MTRLRDLMTTLSKVRYVIWRAGLLGECVEVKLLTGERLSLQKSMILGLATAFEIFVLEGYHCPRELLQEDVRRIVDVGANVGYSLIYWASKFPVASIDAFEPHPKHLQILRRNLEMNRIEERVRIHPVAVGIANGTCDLIDAGAASAITQTIDVLGRAKSGRLQVDVVDFFDAVKGAQIDLLKLDCEGAEYAIVMDPRFANLHIGTLVMEWHATLEHPEAHQELTARLRDLGWKIEPGTMSNIKTLDGLGLLGAGVLWGFRE
jgi:FkbM family methyltransferase